MLSAEELPQVQTLPPDSCSPSHLHVLAIMAFPLAAACCPARQSLRQLAAKEHQPLEAGSPSSHRIPAWGSKPRKLPG